MSEKRTSVDSFHTNMTAKGKTKDIKIYQSISDAIVDCRLAPGAKLPEDSLAEIFGVSRTIIRKVLLNLTNSGLVTSTPHRGSRVARPTVKEGKEVFASRRLVEVAAVPLVIENLTDEKLNELRALDDTRQNAQATLDHHDLIRYSGKFHAAIIDVTDNKTLAAFVHNLISQSCLIVTTYGSAKQRLPDCSGHSDFLELMEAKQVAESQQWMNTRLQEIEASLEFFLKKNDVVDLFKVFSDV